MKKRNELLFAVIEDDPDHILALIGSLSQNEAREILADKRVVDIVSNMGRFPQAHEALQERAGAA
jgi:hypothetical protein